MRHHSAVKKFGRVRNRRLALMRSLARALIAHEQIETTEAKAKALRPFIEKLITKAQTESISTTRLIISRLGGSEREAKKLMKDIAPRYKDRKGGYTRITKIPSSRDDAAKMAVIEFV